MKTTFSKIKEKKLCEINPKVGIQEFIIMSVEFDHTKYYHPVFIYKLYDWIYFRWYILFGYYLLYALKQHK